ncbi:hypothetical protein MTR67_027798 [Solanum verrucosum]|uniref:Uncharacterized protein n=1 Tax=Solanum verrucosum TaxID=315347 RepID=A0AAF0R5C6_SOLVR|nr:hypothetical protein MTR67_027798 [Solanum verrucosum]
MSIRTDMGVKLYVEVKKCEFGFGMYPLYIDTIDKDVGDIESFDVSTSLIVCVEGAEQDILALNLVESENGNLCYIPELEVMNYICVTKSIDVKVDQLYKDKATLISLMAKYKIKHGFNFRVKTSDNKRLIFGSFCPILKEKELGFKRRRREEGEEEEKKEEINKIGQDHCGFSSGVIPIKVCESLVWVYPFPPHTKLVFMI